MLFAFGIEVSTRRFEVWPFAFRNHMEVDGMLSGSQIVEFQFESHAGSLIPDKNISYGFSLSIFDFDFGLGRAPGRKGNQHEKQSEGEIRKSFHSFDLLDSSLLAAGIISQFRHSLAPAKGLIG
jgi:hypothetical protein